MSCDPSDHRDDRLAEFKFRGTKTLYGDCTKEGLQLDEMRLANVFCWAAEYSSKDKQNTPDQTLEIV
jgi:hypothetical protein